ncbi:uncharacterized protein METZ01_LOCUS120120, partial [marine metagenome]
MGWPSVQNFGTLCATYFFNWDFTRIYLGVHYSNQVLGGWVI